MYHSPNIVRVIKSRRLRWADIGFKILTGKPTGKRGLRGPGCQKEDNIIMDLKEIGVNTKNSVDWAQGRKRPCECDIEPPDYISRRVS